MDASQPTLMRGLLDKTTPKATYTYSRRTANAHGCPGRLYARQQNQNQSDLFRRLTETSSQHNQTASCDDSTNLISSSEWRATTPFPKRSMLKAKLMRWRCEIYVVRATPHSSTRSPTTLNFGVEGCDSHVVKPC